MADSLAGKVLSLLLGGQVGVQLEDGRYLIAGLRTDEQGRLCIVPPPEQPRERGEEA